MFADILKSLWLQFPAALLGVRLLVLLVAFTTHELAHALVATALGDRGPRRQGRLTLNPLAHLESIGAILAMLLGVGWSKRTVIYPYRMHVPAWLGGIVAVIAGPLANLGWVLLGLLLMRVLGLSPEAPWHEWPGLGGWLSVLIRFNLMMVLLNVLPLFPLDGFQLIHFLLPARLMVRWQRASSWSTALFGIGLFVFMMLPTRLMITLSGPPMRWIDAVLWGW